MLQADPFKVSSKAKKRGLPQVGGGGTGVKCCELVLSEKLLIFQ